MAKRLVNVDVALDVFFCTVLSTAQQKCLNKSLANKQANKKKKQKQNKETNKKNPLKLQTINLFLAFFLVFLTSAQFKYSSFPSNSCQVFFRSQTQLIIMRPH